MYYKGMVILTNNKEFSGQNISLIPQNIQLHRDSQPSAVSVAALYNFFITSKHVISWQLL